MVGPRGCGPALIARLSCDARRSIPLLFIYNDGDPIDEARLAGFAWRLRVGRRGENARGLAWPSPPECCRVAAGQEPALRGRGGLPRSTYVSGRRRFTSQ